MPQMGESIAEGTVTKWHKKVGDMVERDEPLFEISTDKVDSEIPAPAEGVLSVIKVREGETVPINTVVAVIEGDVEASTSAESMKPTPTLSTKTLAESTAASVSTLTESGLSDSKEKSSPLVRKMAKDRGIALSQIVGTGSRGRITKEDVLSYLDSSGKEDITTDSSSDAESRLAPRSPSSSGKPPSAVSNLTSQPTNALVLPRARDDGYEGREERVAMSPMRQSIAEHMILSRRTSAHVTTVFEADVTGIVEAREAQKHAFLEQEGVKLTYTPFFVRTVVSSLQEYPVLNSVLDGGSVIYRKDYNIGLAVSLEQGLIVPVIKRADERSFIGLARAVSDLVDRARHKKLYPEEVQGGTFTITNPGPYGGLFGTPIINQPQVAILCIGGIHKRPVVVDDAIAIRDMVYLALSFDHRLVDGMLSDQFMADVKRRLEGWQERIL